MLALIKLVLAHLLGDFLLQTERMIAEKETKKAGSRKLYLHVLIHAVLVLLLLADWHWWPLALMVGASHFCIDLVKVYSQKESSRTQWFVADQLLHLTALAILWYLWFEPEIELLPIIQSKSWWLYITAFIFLTVPSAIIMQVLLADWSKKLFDGDDESLENAGKYIGILERLFVLTFIITGQWQPVGFLLAAKSIFRFGDLKESKDRKLTEYILIGTLLSFGLAIITGIVVVKVTS